MLYTGVWCKMLHTGFNEWGIESLRKWIDVKNRKPSAVLIFPPTFFLSAKINYIYIYCEYQRYKTVHELDWLASNMVSSSDWDQSRKEPKLCITKTYNTHCLWFLPPWKDKSRCYVRRPIAVGEGKVLVKVLQPCP